MIRKATKKDVGAINLLGSKLHDNFTKTYHIETEIDSNFAIIFVAQIDLKIAGYLYALDFDDNVDLLSIYIDESYRLNNIGYELINELQKMCNSKTITLEVSKENVGALTLYRKCGFKEVGLRRKYYNGADALIMKWGV